MNPSLIVGEPRPAPPEQLGAIPATRPSVCVILYAGPPAFMEPVTHFLTGACIGRAGFNRKTAYATLAAVLAAEAADLDVFWGFAGPVEELKHHRGITHTFWAVPVVAGRGGGRGLAFTAARARQKCKRNAAGVPISAYPESARIAPAGALGLALRVRLRRRAQPPAARLDQQLRPASVLPLQSPLVRGQLHVYRRAAALGGVFPGFFHAVGARSYRPRDRRAPRAVSRPRLGHLRPCRDGGVSVAGAGQSTRRRWP